MKVRDDELFRDNITLLKAYREGCGSALAKVFRTYAPHVRGFIQRGFVFHSHGHEMFFGGVRQISDADDIIQETFRRAFSNNARHNYDGLRPYRNYLFTIAKNVVLTEERLRRRWVSVEEHGVCLDRVLNAEQHGAPADTHMEGIEVYSIVAAFFETLGDDARELFLTRFLGLESQEHTAKALGWTRSRVRKMEAQIRQSFLRLTADTGYLEKYADLEKLQRCHTHTDAKARSRDLWRAQPALSMAGDMLFDAAQYQP
ncbi:MAG: sigma-70 family RNA polymerase sigma factor [Myxococcales bacterium]|nr:sigma-70 family RNA polymerase sigma factor [Myxococcales bacterium]